MITSRRIRAGAVVTVALVGLLTACQQPSQGAAEGSASRKIYTDVESLANDSSVIVEGRLGAVRSRAVDDGGAGSGEGIPMALYDFTVQRARSATSVPKTITIAWVDTDKLSVSSDDAVVLQQDQDYVFFLDELTEAERGGLQGLGTLYVPISSNAGVFPIKSGKAIATDVELTRVKKSSGPGPTANGRLSTNPNDLLTLETKKE